MRLASSSTQPEKIVFLFIYLRDGGSSVLEYHYIGKSNSRIQHRAYSITREKYRMYNGKNSEQKQVVSVFVQSEDGFINMTYQESMTWMVTIEDSVISLRILWCLSSFLICVVLNENKKA